MYNECCLGRVERYLIQMKFRELLLNKYRFEMGDKWPSDAYIDPNTIP